MSIFDPDLAGRTKHGVAIARIRNFSRAVAQSYYDARERLGFPMLKDSN